MRFGLWIANYGERQRTYLDRMLNELAGFSTVSFEIHLHSTSDHPDLKSAVLKEIVHRPTIGKMLPRAAVMDLRRHIREYDWLGYMENDLLLTEQSFTEMMDHNRVLPLEWICGLLRYEELAGKRYLMDFATVGGGHDWRPKKVLINESSYFQTDNVHQGCWFADRERLRHIGFRFRVLGRTLEAPASNIYRSHQWPGKKWGLQRVMPKDFSHLLIHHLPNKYVRKDDGMKYLGVEELGQLV